MSRQRVYQLVSLVTELPEEIKEYILGSDDPAVLRLLTERRLRPIAGLDDDEAKAAAFAACLQGINASPAVVAT